jgi:excinuclease UvrABC helicase subunit UvrB
LVYQNYKILYKLKSLNEYENNKHNQALLGATETGKMLTVANVINKINTPSLAMAHNETLTTQLY